jgi:hypothetical protein
MRCGAPLCLVSIVALATLGVGCAFEGTRPSHPHPPFFYDECGAGCTVADHAMAAGGAVAHVWVGDEGIAAVRSTRPDVVEVGLSDGLIRARSGRPGQAALQLLDGAGRLVESLTVTVAATAKLGFAAASTYNGAVEILTGSSQRFQVTTQDAAGRTTVGAGSVAFNFEGPLSPLASSPPAADALPFAGRASGSAAVTAYTGGGTADAMPTVSATLAIDVIDPLQLIALDAVLVPAGGDASDGREATAGADGADIAVEITARTAVAPVYGAACAWTADSALVLLSQAAATFESPAHTTSRFRITQPGHFTARCDIGNTTTSVTLRR